jgi:hypothetical protein
LVDDSEHPTQRMTLLQQQRFLCAYDDNDDDAGDYNSNGDSDGDNNDCEDEN